MDSVPGIRMESPKVKAQAGISLIPHRVISMEISPLVLWTMSPGETQSMAMPTVAT